MVKVAGAVPSEVVHQQPERLSKSQRKNRARRRKRKATAKLQGVGGEPSSIGPAHGKGVSGALGKDVTTVALAATAAVHPHQPDTTGEGILSRMTDAARRLPTQQLSALTGSDAARVADAVTVEVQPPAARVKTKVPAKTKTGNPVSRFFSWIGSGFVSAWRGLGKFFSGLKPRLDHFFSWGTKSAAKK